MTYTDDGVTYESVPIPRRTNFNWHPKFRDWVKPVAKEVGPIGPAFIEALIKRSGDAEQVLQDSGRIRFQRAIQAAVELYIEQQKEGQ